VILSLLWLFHSFCTVTDFSPGALPIGVKFCMAVRPDLGQVFSYFWGDSPQVWPSFGRQHGLYGGICFLLKHSCILFSPISLITFPLACQASFFLSYTFRLLSLVMSRDELRYHHHHHHHHHIP